MKNTIIYALIGAVVGLGIGYFVFSHSNSPSEFAGAISTSSTSTFSTAKIAEIGFAPTTASATTSVTLLNTDSTDRVITSAFAYCSGVGTSQTYLTGTGLSALTFTMGTSSNTSNSNPTTVANAFIVTVSTSTPYSYVSSTTTPYPNDATRTWASGSYLLINANATNTASCVTGVHYLAS